MVLAPERVHGCQQRSQNAEQQRLRKRQRRHLHLNGPAKRAQVDDINEHVGKYIAGGQREQAGSRAHQARLHQCQAVELRTPEAHGLHGGQLTRALQLQRHQRAQHANECHQHRQHAQRIRNGKGAVKHQQRLLAQRAVGYNTERTARQCSAQAGSHAIRRVAGRNGHRQRSHAAVIPILVIHGARHEHHALVGGVVIHHGCHRKSLLAVIGVQCYAGTSARQRVAVGKRLAHQHAAGLHRIPNLLRRAGFKAVHTPVALHARIKHCQAHLAKLAESGCGADGLHALHAGHRAHAGQHRGRQRGCRPGGADDRRGNEEICAEGELQPVDDGVTEAARHDAHSQCDAYGHHQCGNCHSRAAERLAYRAGGHAPQRAHNAPERKARHMHQQQCGARHQQRRTQHNHKHARKAGYQRSGNAKQHARTAAN